MTGHTESTAGGPDHRSASSDHASDETDLIAPGLTSNYTFDLAQAIEELKQHVQPCCYDPLSNDELKALCEFALLCDEQDFDPEGDEDDESCGGSEGGEIQDDVPNLLSSAVFLTIWFADELWCNEVGLPSSPWLPTLDRIKRTSHVNANDAMVNHISFFERAREYEHGVAQYLSGAWRSDTLLPKVWASEAAGAQDTVSQVGACGVPEEPTTGETRKQEN